MPLRAIQEGATADVRRVARFLRDAVSDRTLARESVAQALKAGLAAVLAWVVAAHVLGLPLPYLAPWVAMIMVKSTLYWSALTAARQVAAVVLGVGLAVGATALMPGKELALAVLVPVAILLGGWHRLGDQGLYVPFTALFMVTVDSVEGPSMLIRLAETGVGVVIGSAVNLLVFPPIRVRAVGDQARSVGDEASALLRDIGAVLHRDWDESDAAGWADRATRLNQRVADARGALGRARESLRFNPRSPRGRYLGSVAYYRAAADLAGAGAASVQSMTRALRELSRIDRSYDTPDRSFREHYAAVLDAAADALDSRLAELLAGEEVDTDRYDRKPFATLDLMEREVDLRAAAGRSTAELEGALLVAVRQLLHDLLPR